MVRIASCVTIANPKVMTKVLGIVYRTITTHLTHKAGFAKPMAQTGEPPRVFQSQAAIA